MQTEAACGPARIPVLAAIVEKIAMPIVGCSSGWWRAWSPSRSSPAPSFFRSGSTPQASVTQIAPRIRAVYDGFRVSEQSLVEQVAAIFEKHREEALGRGGQSSEAHGAMAQAAEDAVKLLAAELDRLRVERK